MAHTQTWNAAYEALPADTNAISEGALRIRNLKRDTRERLELDHSWDGDNDDGLHKKVTLLESSTPSTVTDAGVVFSKDLSGTTELHYVDSAGNEVQITSSGVLEAFPTGTRMLFQQASPPTGWTSQTTYDNRAIRIVKDGDYTAPLTFTNGYTTIFGSGKATASANVSVAAHTHFIANTDSGGSNLNASIYAARRETGTGDSDYYLQGTATTANVGLTSSAGAGTGAHTHDLTLDLSYLDCIIGVKD